jgi:hypothetical protein
LGICVCACPVELAAGDGVVNGSHYIAFDANVDQCCLRFTRGDGTRLLAPS